METVGESLDDRSTAILTLPKLIYTNLKQLYRSKQFDGNDNNSDVILGVNYYLDMIVSI